VSVMEFLKVAGSHFSKRAARHSFSLVVNSTRTGRHDKRSTQFAPQAAPLDAPRLVPAVFDHLPGPRRLGWVGTEICRPCWIYGSVLKRRIVHFVVRFQKSFIVAFRSAKASSFAERKATM